MSWGVVCYRSSASQFGEQVAWLRHPETGIYRIPRAEAEAKADELNKNPPRHCSYRAAILPADMRGGPL